MRPIWWGILFFIIGALGWVIGIVFTAVSLGKLRVLANLFGYIAIFSLPTALVLELIRKRKSAK